MRIRFVRLLLLTMITAIIAPAPAESAPDRKQVVLIDLPRFDLAEISAEYPRISQMLSTAATGLIAFPGAAPLTPEQVYLFFNSGTIIKLPRQSDGLYNAGEAVGYGSAGQYYQMSTGRPVPSASGVNLNLFKIIAVNGELETTFLGGFGAAIHRLGFQTAAIGNADTDRANRSGAALVMDGDGLIDWSAVGAETLYRDKDFPYGIRTDPDAVLRYYRLFRERSEAMVITLGDLERVESYGQFLEKGRRSDFRTLVLRDYDRLLGRIMDETDFRTTLLIFFTCLPPEKEGRMSTGLTPVALKGPGFDSGVLYSATTRQSGLITYQDLRSAAIKYLHGRAELMPVRQRAGDWREVQRNQSGLVTNYSVRWPLLTVYSYLLIGLMLLLIAGLFNRFIRRIVPALTWFYLFLTAFPAAFLAVALINPLDWVSILAWSFGIAGVIFGIAAWRAKGDRWMTLAWIAGITVGIVLMDGLGNGRLELYSFLGYSAVSAGRFYGIGNEYMGILLGSYIVAVSLLLKKNGRRNAALLWFNLAALCFIFLHPYLGADIGGGITVLMGLGLTNYLWLRQPVRFREIGWWTLIAIAIMVLIGVWDLRNNPNSMSHLGQLLALVRENGVGALGMIITRKLDLNLRLIGSTPLAPLLIGLLLAIPILYRYPPRRVRVLIDRYPELMAGFTGFGITALIGLLVNDSGITAAALMSVYGLIMLMMALSEARGGLNEDNQ